MSKEDAQKYNLLQTLGAGGALAGTWTNARPLLGQLLVGLVEKFSCGQISSYDPLGSWKKVIETNFL